MYQFAYTAIAEELPPPPLPSHNRKLSKAIELIEATDCAAFSSHERLKFLSDFRRLWLSIANDLFRACQDAPQGPQRGLLAAAGSVLDDIECRRFRACEAAQGQILEPVR
jgi:flagellar biosynthesis regulator FlaF